MKKCIVCNSTKYRPVFDEFGIAVVRCRSCGHLYSAFEQTQDYEGYFGEELQGDTYWWNEAHQKMYEAFCRRFMRGRSGKLLDVGCGLGFFLKRLENFSGWQSSGCEISPAAVRFAQEKLSLKNIHCGRLEAANFPPGSFRLITMWDVIEHLPDPDPLLARTFELLEPGGGLFLHTPNGAVQLWKARLKKLVKGMKPEIHYLEARDHMNLYSRANITKVLKRRGFSRVEFVHLPPIQSVAGGRSYMMRMMKNVWWYGAVVLSKATGGRLNLDNLFVLAVK